MQDARSRAPLGARTVVVDGLAIAVAIGWFAYNLSLPDGYKGRGCCDAGQYRHLAELIATYPSWISSCGQRGAGYPIFLRLHLLGQEMLGLPAHPDWITWSLVSAFVLFVGSAYALFWALRYRGVHVPRWALWLLLLHPGLVSYAASPISDSLAASLLLLLFAAVLRLEWRMRPRNLALAAAIGALLAAVALTRVVHYFAGVAFLAGLCVAAVAQAIRSRSVAVLLLPLLTVACVAGLTLPRFEMCRHLGGTFSFMTPAVSEGNLAGSQTLCKVGARTYLFIGTDGKGRTIVVPDPFIQEHFACLPTKPPVLPAVLACFREQAPFVPGYFGKKTVALFDISQLNPHAAAITTPVERWWNRLFSMLGFGGLVSMAVLTAAGVVGWRLALQVALPLLYLWTYLAAMLLPHTEARYGLPLVGPSFMALGLLVAYARGPGWKRWAVGALLLAACGTFVAQTVAWDRADSMLTGVPPAAVRRGEIRGVVGIRPGAGEYAAPLKDAVVMVEGPAVEASPDDPHVVMRHRNHSFQPRVLAVASGTTVDFPNDDPVPHGITSDSPTNPLDVGLYGAAQTRSVTFRAPGIVPLRCSVHPYTRGVVLVHANPYVAVTDEKGRYRIPRVPVGTYDVQVWHEDFVGRRATVSVSARGMTPFDVQLERAR